MIETPEQRHATLALRLLLDEGAPPMGDAAVDWRLLLALARENSVLVRLAARLDRVGLRPPTFVTAEAQPAGARALAALAVVRQIGERCTRHGIEFLFPKALQHFPDTGSDLDLLVLTPDRNVDALILEGLAATLRARDLRDRMAGTAHYWLRGSGLVIDVHHRRLGLVGEFPSYAAALLRERRRRCVVAGEEWFAPAPEDQLLLQGMTRLAVRRSFSIADVVATVAIVRANRLDWRYLVSAARVMGVLPGLSCYLTYVDQIHRALWDRGLLPPEAPRDLTLDARGRVAFRARRYRFPTIRVRNRLYWRQLGTAAGSGDWRSVCRLCRVPALVVAGRLGLVGREPAAAAAAAALGAS